MSEPEHLGDPVRRVICAIPPLPEYLQTGTVDNAETRRGETWYHVRWDDGTGGWYAGDALDNFIEGDDQVPGEEPTP